MERLSGTGEGLVTGGVSPVKGAAGASSGDGDGGAAAGQQQQLAQLSAVVAELQKRLAELTAAACGSSTSTPTMRPVSRASSSPT